ncbi:Crp/Fnr family transcriptional regulator [Flavivirga algicola]|uniref:Crp/Fnr family transcriptional regulator n=1 Tax=Flavivirga algicola TaxID=2729136 RepID=A0ABX1RU93_9FLAO|nr:cyclic nucleotide-binding domain-containing protein [Flavivirga algicola]NMH85915.1 Crp/Fnr family transcriptional regulator [Flavivirga algicola]
MSVHSSFLKILSSIGSFSKEEQQLLKQELQLKELKKDDILLNEGDICSSACFVVSGSFYQYYTDTDLNIHIIDLSVENDWALNHKSFSSRQPSKHIIQAFEDSIIYKLSIESAHKLIGKSQTFLQLMRILEESTTRVSFFDNNYTPDEKYAYILENKPELLQTFPQKLIASYLKITPETLSRVRKRLG